jgi:hypothetical protein
MQKRNNYLYSLACEATLNIAAAGDSALMREAMFETIFCRYRSPDADAQRRWSKNTT